MSSTGQESQGRGSATSSDEGGTEEDQAAGRWHRVGWTHQSTPWHPWEEMQAGQAGLLHQVLQTEVFPGGRMHGCFN